MGSRANRSNEIRWASIGLLCAGLATFPAGGDQDDVSRWKQTLERVSTSVVSVRVDRPRSFAGGGRSSSQATGFVVDADSGLLLTNRHVVTSGPVVAEAVFANHEEVRLRAVYRDPVHDFGFYRYDPEDLEHVAPKALVLAPEAATLGTEIRVVGNDSGEKISILDGTLARLDRPAPRWDFNTFYIQAASSTSGGSSGSPVIDVRGRVVALNAGSNRKTATSLYLPLWRVVRALEALRAGEVPSRGTLQTVFSYTPYDELRRLGLSSSTESHMRSLDPGALGMLEVDVVVPGGPADGTLEPGDILVRIGSRIVTDFVTLEDVLDGAAGRSVAIEVERRGKRHEYSLPVDDLHALSPDEYLEVGGAVLHDFTYLEAQRHQLPLWGVTIASDGYIFERAGIPAERLITAIDGEPVRVVIAVLVLAGLALAWNLGRVVHDDEQWRSRAERTRAGYVLLTAGMAPGAV